jgi:hypothetical protein
MRTRTKSLLLGGAVTAGVLAASYGRRVRPWMHRWGATADELESRIPGDDLVKNPTYETTLAVTVRARPREIWPWLLQMGRGRGGIYSYDWLDRLFGVLDAPSANRILSEFQSLAPGDVIPVGHGPGFPVKEILSERALVMGDADVPGGFAWSWTLAIVPLDAARSRLISRNRVRMPRRPSSVMMMAWLDPASFIMTRKMLLGIRRRAESLAA